jgi:amidase
MDKIIYSTATEIAQAIRDKQVSSVEAVQAHLDRIEEVNPRLNAVVLRTTRSAMRAAQRADEAVANGDDLGPFHGVPATIKDAYEVAGVVSTGGTLGRKDYVPEADATPVARLKKAGVVIMGKTNLPEISMGFESSNLVYGRTNNPFDLGRTPGGSSGGEAAIIAAGGSPLGIGSDAGGSIRWPAHCTGIAGLKPTSGRIPKTGHWPAFGGIFSLVTQPGPMARSVRDLATALGVLAGPDGLDPTTVPVPLGDPDEVDLGPLRVAFHTSNGVSIPTAELQAAVRKAADLLDGTAAKVKEDMPGALETTPALHAALMGADAGQVAQQILREAGSPEMDPDLKARIAMMPPKPVPVIELLDTLVDLENYRSAMIRFMRGYDVMIGPAAPVPAALHHHGYDGFPESGSYSHAYNLAGWPALVIRGGTSPEGMPLGIQIIASPWREDLVLAVGMFLQEALGEFSRPEL